MPGFLFALYLDVAKGKTYSIRGSLTLTLTFLVLLIAGLSIGASYFRALKASEKLAEEVINEAALAMEVKVKDYFLQLEQTMLIVQDWIQTAELNTEDDHALGDLLIPLINRSPRVSSIMVADTKGRELLFLQDPKSPRKWLSRWVDPKIRGKARIRRWDSIEGFLQERYVDLEYNTLERTYYQEAIRSVGNAVAWTEPGIFFVTRDPGITAVRSFTSGEDTLVLGFDLLLLDLCYLTMQADFSANGKAFLISNKEPKRVVALPSGAAELDIEAIRKALLAADPNSLNPDAAPELPLAGLSGLAALDTAVQVFASQVDEPEKFSFHYEGENWLGSFKPIQVGRNDFFLGTIAPQSDFIEGFAEEMRQIGFVAFLALLSAVLLARFVALRFAKPLEALVVSSRKIQRLQLDKETELPSRIKELRDLQTQQERARTALNSFVRYLPMDIVKELIRRKEVAKVGGKMQEITVLFTDIEGFTSISEGRRPDEVTALLSDYFEILLETIRFHGGEVNQLLGDGVEAYWGAPTPLESHAEKAVVAILACEKALEELNLAYKRAGKPELKTRFGLASGMLMVGNVGSKSRLSYTAIGDTENLASRIEGLNKFYGTRLLVSQKCRQLAGDRVEWRKVDCVRVKGKSEAVNLYEPLGLKSQVSPDVLQFRDAYESLLEKYQKGVFKEARVMVQELLLKQGDEPSLLRLKELLDAQTQDTASENWDSITNYFVK